MLSADIKHIELLKRTYPLVKQNSVEVGSHTYAHMFKKNPELKKLFASTSPGQAQRLMDAILFYCEEVDNYNIFYERLDAIAQVHIKAGVKNEFYVEMKDAFLLALQEVLGEEADKNFLRAWEYGFESLANELIHIENLIRKYQKH